MTFRNSNVAKGQYGEYAVWKKLETMGFPFIIRSYSSRGPIDLLCANSKGELWAVQVKSSKHGSYLSPKELERLVEWSQSFRALPVFAYKKKARWIFKPLVSPDSIQSAQKEAVAAKGAEQEDLTQALYEEILQDEYEL